MSGAKGAMRAAVVVMGAVAALTGYVLGVKPYLERRSMHQLELEARQVYLLRQQRLAGDQGQRAGSDSHGSDKERT